MGKGIHAGGSNEFRRFGFQKTWIYQCNIRCNGPAEDGHLYIGAFVGDHGKLADIRSGSGGGRCANQGRDGLGDQVAALVFMDPAMV
jgi:hypothetical protein